MVCRCGKVAAMEVAIDVVLWWLLEKLRVVVSSSCEAGRVSAHVVLSDGVSSSCEARRVSQHSLC